MDRDGTAAHGRHRLGPGAAPSATRPAHLRAASEVAELQRSRSVGGLHQKGDRLSCIKKLCKELESEDPEKDVRSEAEDAGCQASLKDEQGQDAPGQEQEGEKVQEGKEAECRAPTSSLKASSPEEPGGGESAATCTPEAQEQQLESIELDDLETEVVLGLCPEFWDPLLSQKRFSQVLTKKPSVFVEIDLGDHTEEVTVRIMKEEKWSQMDTGDVSEDESRISWVCCIPYSTRKKAKASS